MDLEQRIKALNKRIERLESEFKEALNLYRRIQIDDESTLNLLWDEIRKLKATIEKILEE